MAFPADQTDPQSVSGIEPPNQSTPTKKPKKGAAATGGSAGGFTGRFHADELIGSAFRGLSPEQTNFIRDELGRQGLDEKSDPKAYREAMTKLAADIPGLKKMSLAEQLFSDQGAHGATADPLAAQMFFFQTVAPYLEHIRQQTSSMTNPLYAQAQSALPAKYRGQLSPFITAMQGGQENLQGALAGAAASAPALDALMANVTAARQAAQKSYFESERAATAGGTGGTDIASLMQAFGVKPGG